MEKHVVVLSDFFVNYEVFINDHAGLIEIRINSFIPACTALVGKHAFKKQMLLYAFELLSSREEVV